jgi:hypothetical protein
VIEPPPYSDIGWGVYAGEHKNLCIPQFRERISPGVVSSVSTTLISEASGWNVQLLGSVDFLVDEFEHHKVRNEDFQVLMIVAIVATAARHLDTNIEIAREDWDNEYERMNLCLVLRSTLSDGIAGRVSEGRHVRSRQASG